MTDNEICELHSNVSASFFNCVGGQIVWGEQKLAYFTPDGRYGGMYDVGGNQRITRAYWDKMRGYIDIIHVETTGPYDHYITNGSVGLL